MKNSPHRLNALEIRMELIVAIEKAVERGEDGITYKEMQALLGLSYYECYSAVSELVAMGVVTIASRPDRNVRRIALPGWEPPATLNLTRKQQDALNYLMSVMDAEGFARASFRDIVKGSNASKGGIVATLDALDVKGFLSVVERGHGTQKTLFHVYPEGDGPRRHSPMKPTMRSMAGANYPLTEPQRRVLNAMEPGRFYNAYSLAPDYATRSALIDYGFVESKHDWPGMDWCLIRLTAKGLRGRTA